MLEKVVEGMQMEELIDLVRGTLIDDYLYGELIEALSKYESLTQNQKRVIGGLIPGILPPPLGIDFLGFARSDIQLENLRMVGDCACIYSTKSYLSAEVVGSSAFVFSIDGWLHDVRVAGDYTLASASKGSVQSVDSLGRYSFFDAEEVAASVGHVEEIYDPKSGVIIADSVDRIAYDLNDPAEVRIIAGEVGEGREYAQIIGDRVRSLRDDLKGLSKIEFREKLDLNRDIL